MDDLTDLISDCHWTRTHNHLVRKQSTQPFSQTSQILMTGLIVKLEGKITTRDI